MAECVGTGGGVVIAASSSACLAWAGVYLTVWAVIIRFVRSWRAGAAVFEVFYWSWHVARVPRLSLHALHAYDCCANYE